VEEQKNKGGRTKVYQDIDFLSVLSEKPQTTGQILTELKKKHPRIIHDTVLKKLLKLSEDSESGVIRDEIPAASGTGKMYLWRRKVGE
jgi:hypothetical protein